MPLPAFLTALAPGLLPGLASMASNLFGAQTQRENVDKTNAANMALAQYQYSKDLEMWNMGNKYNAPEAQMERLRAAGLNPNMVYGSGSPAGQSAGQLPKFNAPTMSYNYKPSLDPLSMLQAFQDFQIKGAQKDNLDAQRKNTEARTYNEDVHWSIMRNQEQMGLKKLEREGIEQSLLRQKYEQSGQIFPTQLEYQRMRTDVGRRQMDKLLQDIEQSKTMQDKLKADTDLTKEKVDWYTWQLFGRLGIDAAGQLMKLLPASKLGGLFRSGNSGPVKEGRPQRMPGENEGAFISRMNAWMAKQKNGN